MPNPQKGFTLVELAVVLVILGLLVGGIMTGQNMIRAAELRSVMTEKEKILVAVSTFQEEYMGLPGDLDNAEDYWGTAPNCPGNTNQGMTDGTTCNGDGNGRLGYTDPLGASNGLDYNPDSQEWYRFWQHLANAGLYEGVYNGVVGGGDLYNHSVIGVNVPAAKLSNAGWTARYYGDYGGDTETYDSAALTGNYGHILDFGSETADDSTRDPILSPEEVWNIDTKMDDGRPAHGNVIVRHFNDCSDSTNNTDINSDYVFTETGPVCAIIFRNQF